MTSSVEREKGIGVLPGLPPKGTIGAPDKGTQRGTPGSKLKQETEEKKKGKTTLRRTTLPRRVPYI